MSYLNPRNDFDPKWNNSATPRDPALKRSPMCDTYEHYACDGPKVGIMCECECHGGAPLPVVSQNGTPGKKTYKRNKDGVMIMEVS